MSALGSIPGSTFLSAICFGIAAAFFATAKDPGRNRLTRFVAWYSGYRYVRGFDSASQKGRLVTIAILCVALGVFVIVLAFAR